jgi:hypothetical protein
LFVACVFNIGRCGRGRIVPHQEYKQKLNLFCTVIVTSSANNNPFSAGDCCQKKESVEPLRLFHPYGFFDTFLGGSVENGKRRLMD